MRRTHKAIAESLRLMEDDYKNKVGELSEDIAAADSNIAALQQKQTEALDEHERIAASQAASIKEVYADLIAMEERRKRTAIERRDRLTAEPEAKAEPEPSKVVDMPGKRQNGRN